MSLQHARYQAGFTLIEFMVVISLISLAVSMVVIDFKEANGLRESKQALEELKTIINVTRTLKDHAANYAGITAVQVARSPAFPPYMRAMSGSSIAGIDAPILGGVRIGASSAGFWIAPQGVFSQDRCIYLGSKIINSISYTITGVSSGWFGGGLRYTYRSTVVAGAGAGKPAAYYFDPRLGYTAASCRRASNNYEVYYVDQ